MDREADPMVAQGAFFLNKYYSGMVNVEKSLTRSEKIRQNVQNTETSR